MYEYIVCRTMLNLLNCFKLYDVKTKIAWEHLRCFWCITIGNGKQFFLFLKVNEIYLNATKWTGKFLPTFSSIDLDPIGIKGCGFSYASCWRFQCNGNSSIASVAATQLHSMSECVQAENKKFPNQALNIAYKLQKLPPSLHCSCVTSKNLLCSSEKKIAKKVLFIDFFLKFFFAGSEIRICWS